MESTQSNRAYLRRCNNGHPVYSRDGEGGSIEC